MNGNKNDRDDSGANNEKSRNIKLIICDLPDLDYAIQVVTGFLKSRPAGVNPSQTGWMMTAEKFPAAKPGLRFCN